MGREHGGVVRKSTAEPRSRLTWLDKRGKRSGILVDRPGRALLVTQAAWATLAGREPLLNGEPPYASPTAAREALHGLLGQRYARSLARRALLAAGEEVPS